MADSVAKFNEVLIFVFPVIIIPARFTPFFFNTLIGVLTIMMVFVMDRLREYPLNLL